MERNVFSTKERLALALSDAVAENILDALDQRDHALIAVSGGTTPMAFFEALSQRDDIDWEDVTITLVDERWVDETSDRSNARLVKENLMQGFAKAAKFVPLYAGTELPDAEGIAKANAAVAGLNMPFDAVVLGMGNDGHTASFFPEGDTLAEALSENGPLIALNAPGAGEPRVTFTLPQLLNTNALYLHIEGDQKAAVLDQALQDGPIEDMPIRAVLSQEEKTVQLFWCP